MTHIGTSGWSYEHWTGVLYPSGTTPYQRLGYYLARFNTVELNSSYYRWPSTAAFRSWRRRLPEGFRFAIKAPRTLTHQRCLYAPEEGLAQIENGLISLRERCGPLLVQLPPTLPCDYARLAYFLEKVPYGRQVALEFRHPSWHTERIFELLEKHHAAYCVMSGARLPCVLRATAPFVYIRLHGPDPNHLYAGSYSEDSLRWWAARISEWEAMGKSVFAYFNNDGEGNAVCNALRLKELLRR
jgi:uncharacterized protein YecE (DUF72 family)